MKFEPELALYKHGIRLRLICENGYVLSNPNRTQMKCAKGKWKPEPPDCIPGNGQLNLNLILLRAFFFFGNDIISFCYH